MARPTPVLRHDDVARTEPTAPGDRPIVDREALQRLMWEHAGLERSAAGLLAASARLDGWRAPESADRRTAEDRNLLDLARLTVAAALARTHSVGAHFRIDDPHVPDAGRVEPAVRQPALEEAA